ncbi:MAG: hypothetical protein FWB80_05070 [Defluviitaleaceae bacterium]|nr:hypothetical protein [Defluviitaleaceae bacterium]
MDKTYKFVNHENPLPMEEIRQLYEGYWVFLVNANFSETMELLSGRPVIIGARQYDGALDGIYEKYDSPEYGITADKSLLTKKFITSLRAAGALNA